MLQFFDTDFQIALLAVLYFNVFKLVGIALLTFGWAKFTEWADKDALAVNTYRQLWNMGHLATGLVAIGCAMLIPNFALGYILGLIIFAGEAIAYVIHRNGLVTPESTVLTAAHFQRIQEQGLFGNKRKKEREVVERITLRASRGVVRAPDSGDERVQYAQVQDLFSEFLLRRASRVDVVPSGEVTKISYEIDGQVFEREPLDRPSGDALVQYLKSVLGLNLEEKRKPQTGKLTAKLGATDFDLRLRTDGSTAGEKLGIRVIGPEAKYKSADLGFTPKQLEEVKEILAADEGLVLVSAPPKHGLTTTVYSLTRSHDAFLKNIQLLEYSTEMEIDNVTQKAFTPKEGVTFTDELLKLIRSDPDILIVPELREPQSPPQLAKAALKSKIYTCLSATSIEDSITKWLRLNNDPELVAKGFLGAINQRLLRKLCAQCKEAYKPAADQLKKLNLPADAVLYRPPQPQYDKQGNVIPCAACGGANYIGRTAVFEVLLADDALRDAIRRGGAAEISAVVQRGGNTNLQRQAMAKVLDGQTSIQELARVLRAEPAAPGAAPAPAAAAKRIVANASPGTKPTTPASRQPGAGGQE